MATGEGQSATNSQPRPPQPFVNSFSGLYFAAPRPIARTRAPHRPPRSQTSLWCLEVRFSIALAHHSDAVPEEPGARSTSGVRSEACGWSAIGEGSCASTSFVVWRGKMAETSRAYLFAHVSHADHGSPPTRAAPPSRRAVPPSMVNQLGLPQECHRWTAIAHGSQWSPAVPYGSVEAAKSTRGGPEAAPSSVVDLLVSYGR